MIVMGSEEVLYYSLPIKFKIVSTTASIHILFQKSPFQPSVTFGEEYIFGVLSISRSHNVYQESYFAHFYPL